MLIQCKYAFRHHLGQRLFALGGALGLSLIFVVLAKLGFLGVEGVITTGIVFASLSLCAIMVVSTMADVSSMRALLQAPQGYLLLQAPVAPGKIVAARLLAMTVLDLVSLAVGIANVVVISMLRADALASSGFFASGIFESGIFAGLLFLVLGYGQLLALVLFCATLSKTYLYRFKGRVILAIIATVAVEYLFSWMYMLLAPFGVLFRHKFIFTVSLTQLNSPAGYLYTGIIALQLALLVAACAHMIKRRNNL